MKTLDIPAGSRLKVLKTTPHKETHGKTLIQAVSLRIEWYPLDNAALNLLDDGLQDALVHIPDDVKNQNALEGIPDVKKWRRCPGMAMPVKVPKREFTGYTARIEYGIDDETELELYSCKLDKFEADVKEGGICVIRWSMNSSRQITPEMVGALCALEGVDVKLSLTPPDESDAIDGSQEGFERDQKDNGRSAGDLFAAEHGGSEDHEDEDETTEG